MKILAIETSCDDTGIAILNVPYDGSFDVLSNIVSSQIEVHKKYGGVYPAMAKREHQKNLVPTLVKALKEAKLLIQKSKSKSQNYNSKLKIIGKILEREPKLYKKLIPFLKKYEKPDANVIAVTNGPGLEPCLWVGVNFTKALSYFWNIPIVPVNHIESHILVNLLENKNITFPSVALVVSGGHTQIILMKKIGKYEILGETRDDAAGECFDKCAKILGLGYPGGPIISKLAAQAVIPSLTGNPVLPRPMMFTKDYDFSFSGLKTAVLYAWQKNKQRSGKFFASRQKTYQTQIAFAAEVQQAVIDVLIKKTMKAAKDYKAKTIILGGGVSANNELREQFENKMEKEVVGNFAGAKFPTTLDKPAVRLFVPRPDLSTDNALMAAITGFYHKKEKISPSAGSGRFLREIAADGNLRIK